MKLLGIVNHRSKFFRANFAPNFMQNSAPRKSFSRTISRRISCPSGTASRFSSLLTQRIWNPKKQEIRQGSDFSEHPSFSLIACHHLEASHYHTCDQDENRGWEQKFSEQSIFLYRSLRMCFCRMCGTNICEITSKHFRREEGPCLGLSLILKRNTRGRNITRDFSNRVICVNIT